LNSLLSQHSQVVNRNQTAKQPDNYGYSTSETSTTYFTRFQLTDISLAYSSSTMALSNSDVFRRCSLTSACVQGLPRRFPTQGFNGDGTDGFELANSDTHTRMCVLTTKLTTTTVTTIECSSARLNCCKTYTIFGSSSHNTHC
jgi:hypothetical protein